MRSEAPKYAPGGLAQTCAALLLLCCMGAPAYSQEDGGTETEPEIILDDDLVGDVGSEMEATAGEGRGADTEVSLLSHAASFLLPAVELKWRDGAGVQQTAYGWGILFWDTKNSSWRSNNWSRGHAAAWVTKDKNPKGPRIAIEEIGVQFFFLRNRIPAKGPKLKANASAVTAGWDSGKGINSFKPGQVCAERRYRVGGVVVLPPKPRECKRLL